MRRITVAVAALLSTMVAVAAFAAAPAAASTHSSLRITITPLATSSGVASSSVSALLQCDPPGGTHPYAEKACADIEAVHGDIAAIKPMPDRYCLAVWQPVKISVQGVWRWQKIDFGEIHSNLGCAMISHGHVFYL